MSAPADSTTLADSRPRLDGTTEWLAKSLFGIGVLMAFVIPLGTVFAVLTMGHWPGAALFSSESLVLFCLGLWFLQRTFGFTRRSQPAAHVGRLWLIVSLYLLYVLYAVGSQIWSPDSPPMPGPPRSEVAVQSQEILLMCVGYLLLPLAGLLLSLTLWVRHLFRGCWVSDEPPTTPSPRTSGLSYIEAQNLETQLDVPNASPPGTRPRPHQSRLGP